MIQDAPEKLCPVCGSVPGKPCLVAVEYFPTWRAPDGTPIPGERRPEGVYLARSPHLKRL